MVLKALRKSSEEHQLKLEHQRKQKRDTAKPTVHHVGASGGGGKLWRAHNDGRGGASSLLSEFIRDEAYRPRSKEPQKHMSKKPRSGSQPPAGAAASHGGSGRRAPRQRSGGEGGLQELLGAAGSALAALGGGSGHASKLRRISAVPRARQIAIEPARHRGGKRGAVRRGGGPAPSAPVPVPAPVQAAVVAPIAAVTASTPNAPIAPAPVVLVPVVSPPEAPVTSALAEHEFVAPHHTPGVEPPSSRSQRSPPAVCVGSDGGAGPGAGKALDVETTGAQATGAQTVRKGATDGGTAGENAPRASTTTTDARTTDKVVTGGETAGAIAPRAQKTGPRPTGEEVTGAQSTGVWRSCSVDGTGMQIFVDGLGGTGNGREYGPGRTQSAFVSRDHSVFGACQWSDVVSREDGKPGPPIAVGSRRWSRAASARPARRDICDSARAV